MASRSSCPRRARCAASHRRPASSTRNASARALPCLFGEQSPEEPCDLTQRRPPGRRLYARVVVGGGVHVVGHQGTVGPLDELETANLDAVPPREGQVPADDRMIESRTQSEQAGLAETGAAHAGTLADAALTGTLAAHADGARISRAQLESASLGVRGDRVHVLAAHNLNPGDERPHGLHILLEQRDPVDRRRVRGRTNVLSEGLMAVEAAHTQPSATLVVLGYERHGEL